jgi:hypothetical protein
MTMCAAKSRQGPGTPKSEKSRYSSWFNWPCYKYIWTKLQSAVFALLKMKSDPGPLSERKLCPILCPP